MSPWLAPAIGGEAKRRCAHLRQPCQSSLSWPTFWRRDASTDLHDVAERFGADLADVHLRRLPPHWLDFKSAMEFLVGQGVIGSRRDVKRADVLEVYAGTCHFTRACVKAGLSCPVSVDETPSASSTLSWDLLAGHWRRLLWAVLVVFEPKWVHSGFPCRFWVRMTHFQKRATPHEYALERLQELAHVILTVQIAYYQKRRSRHFSMEQPP